MTYLRDRRRTLGWLALAAPLPLPFSQVLEWPFILIYWGTVALFLRRSKQEAVGWLPNWAMNLLGLAYLPILVLDLTVFWRGQLLLPVIHLIMFALVVKLFSIKRDRDAWHAFIGAFFLTLAAMGTSVHPLMMVYLAAIILLHLRVMTRFATIHMLERFGRREPSPAAVPMNRFLIAATFATLLVALPIFLVLPRIRTPYIVASGAGTEGLVTGSRFSGELGLDATSRSRTNRAVALRFAYEPPGMDRAEFRFKVASYERFTGRGWQRSPPARKAVRRGRDGFFRLSNARFGPRLRIWQLPSSSADLAIPVETVTVDLPVPRLVLSRGGDLSLTYPTQSIVEYVVGLGRLPISAGKPPGADPLAEPTRVTTAIDPRIVELAREVAGDGSPQLQAQRIEVYLTGRYGYSLEFVGRGGSQPVESFLFDRRRGHCELFASSMVLMLRSVGIPARFVAGFLGGELNALEDYYVVRQSDRHAWVEAYFDDLGWILFDPTPPAGRPSLSDLDLESILGQAWDYLAFRWDRYVLTYGIGDQLDLALRLRQIFGWIGESLRGENGSAGEDLSLGTEESPVPEEVGSPIRSKPSISTWLPFLLLVLSILIWLRFRSLPFTGQRAWQRLRRTVRRDRRPLPDHLPPLEVYRLLEEQHPAAARPGRQVLRLYLRESFGGAALDEDERNALRECLNQALRASRRSGP